MNGMLWTKKWGCETMPFNLVERLMVNIPSKKPPIVNKSTELTSSPYRAQVGLFGNVEYMPRMKDQECTSNHRERRPLICLQQLTDQKIRATM